jgi:hypothetical protein
MPVLILTAAGFAFFKPAFYAMFANTLNRNTENQSHMNFIVMCLVVNMAAFIGPFMMPEAAYHLSLYIAGGALVLALVLGIIFWFINGSNKLLRLKNGNDDIPASGGKSNLPLLLVIIVAGLLFTSIEGNIDIAPIISQIRDSGQWPFPMSWLYLINPLALLTGSVFMIFILLYTKIKTSTKLILSFGLLMAGLCLTSLLPVSVFSIVLLSALSGFAESILPPLVLAYIGRYSPSKITAIIYAAFMLISAYFGMALRLSKFNSITLILIIFVILCGFCGFGKKINDMSGGDN